MEIIYGILLPLFPDMNAACAILRQIHSPAYRGLLSKFSHFALQIKVLCTEPTELSKEHDSSRGSDPIRDVQTTSAAYVCRLRQEVPSICYHKKYKAI